jgi:predicted regulator of Ras-like GTPase activity (Roadblock/LC7/MglB family)
MSELESALVRLRGHEGVQDLILLGRDGLVIRHLGNGGNEEAVAARVPGIAAACGALGSAAATGALATAVLEFDSGVAIVTVLSADMLLALLVQPGVGFAPLLRDLRRERRTLVELL